MIQSFGTRYAKYYDSLYADKDYPSECDYIQKVIKMYHPSRVRRLLDLSCGTGGHSLVLASRGYEVDALDASEGMLSVARSKGSKQRRIRFFNQDMRRFQTQRKYDVCLSVFGSLNYVIEDAELESVFLNVARHLEKDGIFLFDVWYGPAVLTQRPEARVKDVKSGRWRILRIATPSIDYATSTNTTAYKVLVFKKNKKVDEFSETHRVRYFFIPEIATLMKRTGFRLVSVHPFMLPRKRPTSDHWNVSFVGRRTELP